MSHNNFPKDWDDTKIEAVLAHYRQQSEEEAVAEDEAGVAPKETVMRVPFELVPVVRKLILKHGTE